MGAVHMIMESIKSLWCWTFYRQILRMHPPIKEKPSFVKKKIKINLLLFQKFNLTGAEMKVVWKCVHWNQPPTSNMDFKAAGYYCDYCDTTI